MAEPSQAGRAHAAPRSAARRRTGWARLRRYLRPPRRLRFTREGKYYVLMTIGIGFAAVNTGNNLLYLILGWMLSMIVASGVLSELTLRGLHATRRPPPRVFAGRPVLMGIAVENEKGRLPSFSVEVEDLIDQKTLDKRCFFLKVPAGREQSTTYRHIFPHRGLYELEGLRLSTLFPFALFRKSLDVDAPGEVLVFPAVFPVTPPSPGAELGGEDPLAKRGRRGELHGLRDFRFGDDPRDVHWRSTARHGRLMVREHDDESRRRATILLDNALPQDATADDRAGLERAISLAASLAVAWAGRRYLVRLVARGALVPSSADEGQTTRVLRALALLDAAPPGTPFSAGPERGAENVLVARRGHAPAGLPPHVGRVLEA